MKSNQPPDQLMIYGHENHLSEIKTLQFSTKHCTEQVQKLSMEVTELKQQLESSKKQLHSAHCVLRGITNEKLLLKKQREISEKKTCQV